MGGRGSFRPRGHLEKILNPRTGPRVSRAITTELETRGRLGQAPRAKEPARVGVCAGGLLMRLPNSAPGTV